MGRRKINKLAFGKWLEGKKAPTPKRTELSPTKREVYPTSGRNLKRTV